MKNGKILVLALIFVLVTGALFAQNPITELQKGVEDFSSAMAKALPFNSTMGLNWSDAYIGQIVGVPPHFGVGLFLGSTLLDSGDIETLAHAMNANVPGGFSKLPYPGFGAEGRVGGFLLPFDAGIKIAALPSLSDDFDLHHFMLGGDIRYAILKGNAALPKLSLGVGFNYMSGGMGIDIPGTQSYSVGGDTLTLASPKAEFTWQTLTLDIKAQVSKSFAIVTPYLGAGLTHGWSEAGYEITSNLTYNNGSPHPLADSDKTTINDALKGAGLEPIDFDGASGFSSIIKNTQWGFRLFGGLAFNLALIKIDLSGLYNFNDQSFGLTLGTRFQL
ncbi:MAG: hypothetical protein LBI85_04145 [Spirochaetaceae bacterium]|jgi:opacity protein-like surface antigen|nr:hypothetical protein [Spirochaetaceae bacterium]